MADDDSEGKKQPDPSWLKAGERIAQLREARGWRQDDLATASGVAQAQISRYEAGARGMTAKTASQLARTFGVSIETLLGDAPVMDADAERDPLPNRRALRMSTHWMKAAPQARAAIAGYAESGGDLPLDEWLAELRLLDRKVRRGESLETTTDAVGRPAEEDVPEEP